jgi:uncharacterized membrane protein HdeD (DUF308 family)
MTNRALPSLLPHFWMSALVSGLLAVALGIAMIAWPGISIAVAAIFFGVYLLFSGIEQVFLALSLRVSGLGRLLLFISGAASVALAVLAFLHLSDAILLMAIWIAIGFIFRGVATSVSAISDPMLPGRTWNIVVGIISLLAGVMILWKTFETLYQLAVIVGCWLVVIGVMEIVAAIGMRMFATSIEKATETAIT